MPPIPPINFTGSSSANSRSQSGDIAMGGVQLGGGFFDAEPLNVGLIVAGVIAVSIAAVFILRK